jgi:hypothetical protein
VRTLATESNNFEQRSNAGSVLYRALRTIYALKVGQMLLILIVLTITFYVADLFSSKSTTWISWVPFKALADACFTAVIIGFTYEWLVRKESEGALAEIFVNKLNEHRKAIIDAIPTALLTDKSIIRQTFSKEKIEDVIRTTLQVRLGDILGDQLFYGFLRKTVAYEELWENYRFKATLELLTDSKNSLPVRQKYYQAYVDVRYETILKRTSFRFVCVPNVEEYNQLLRDASYQVRWIFPPGKDLPEINEMVFGVSKMNVDGVNLSIRKENRSDGRFVLICENPDLESKLNAAVTISYRYAVKIKKRGHLLTSFVPYPTKGVTIELDFAKTDIHVVNVFDYFVSNQNPIIRYMPSEHNPHRIEVELNEWVFPKGGVVFVWVLKPELSEEFLKLLGT